MAKLAELVGGILKDLAQGRILVDFISREYFDIYQEDPIMAQMPVPRLAIKDVTLKLKFAIEASTSIPLQESDDTFFGRLWQKELTERVVLDLLKSNLKKPADLKRIADFGKMAVKPIGLAGFSFTEAKKGKPEKILKDSIDCIMSGLEKLPPDIIKQLAAGQSLNVEIEQRIQKQLELFIPRIQQLASVRQALQMELDVTVRNADLAKTQESNIQEITLSIGMDDLRVATENTQLSKKDK